jgi:hypothetical protein
MKQNNGGTLVDDEKQAKLKIVDHTKKNPPPDSYVLHSSLFSTLCTLLSAYSGDTQTRYQANDFYPYFHFILSRHITGIRSSLFRIAFAMVGSATHESIVLARKRAPFGRSDRRDLPGRRE